VVVPIDKVKAKEMRKTCLLIGVALLVIAGPSMAAGDPVIGKVKTAVCEGCHGIPGWRTAYPEVYSVPKLGGQHPQYIAKALQEYKSGQRSFATMRAIAANLSDQDIADIAAYYGDAGK
jgi:cytochrome c553